MRFTIRRGSEHPNAVLSPGEAEKIRERFEECHSRRQVARETGVNRETVRKIINHESYRDGET